MPSLANCISLLSLHDALPIFTALDERKQSVVVEAQPAIHPLDGLERRIASVELPGMPGALDYQASVSRVLVGQHLFLPRGRSREYCPQVPLLEGQAQALTIAVVHNAFLSTVFSNRYSHLGNGAPQPCRDPLLPKTSNGDDWIGRQEKKRGAHSPNAPGSHSMRCSAPRTRTTSKRQ